MTDIEPADWQATLDQAHSQGYAYLDFLTAIDRGHGVEVVAHVLNPDTREHLMFSTHVTPSAGGDVDLVLGSLAPRFRSAEWHEREAAEMFGIRFAGHPDPRPLLLRSSSTNPPLRKSFALAERVDKPWPGAAEPEGATGRARRGQRAPGVLDEWRESRP